MTTTAAASALHQSAQRLRIRLAEVQAREAHCRREEAAWEERGTAADADGDERLVIIAEGRLRALEQARRRNAQTLGRLTSEIGEVERQLHTADLEAKRSATVAAYDAALSALREVADVDGSLMREVRERWTPMMATAHEAIRKAALLESELDLAEGRRPRAVARVVDRLGADVPGGLWRLGLLGQLQGNDQRSPANAVSG